MDCIEKFQAMQDCFREYPDVYAAELAGDDDDELEDLESKGGESGDGLSDEEKERKKELVKEIRDRRRKQADKESADKESAAKAALEKGSASSQPKNPGDKRLLEADAPVQRKKLILKAHERESSKEK